MFLLRYRKNILNVKQCICNYCDRKVVRICIYYCFLKNQTLLCVSLLIKINLRYFLCNIFNLHI